jgi:hypothetical protein
VELTDGSEQACFKILDAVPGFVESCLDEVDWEQYKVVGFSVTFAQTIASLFLARRLKERYPHLVIVFWGSQY